MNERRAATVARTLKVITGCISLQQEACIKGGSAKTSPQGGTAGRPPRLSMRRREYTIAV